METPRDPSTCANYEDVTVRHYDIDWDVNLHTKQITGNIDIFLDAIKQTDQIVFDVKDLVIDSISCEDKKLNYTVVDSGVLGQKLSVEMALCPGDSPILKCKYTTSPKGATAIQVLTKEQTTDKKAPFLFSQCQPAHARTLMPCMDTPSVKSTYSSRVRVPAGLTCLMSAVKESEKQLDGGLVETRFVQKVPIASYLLAIVVGVLERRKISDRCDVWCEPSIADSAAYEFAETEKILQVAEELAGKYRWGRYDLVVLPNSFPFGGMENPCLTFVTPGLLAGDRSLVNVIAHEIAHSWTGNLVSNCSWEHFWLNEGFTVFLERKILGRMHGELLRQFASENGFETILDNTVNSVFGPQHPFTKLILNLEGVDPDESYSTVPYEKGSALLFAIELALGDKERFEDFLRKYIDKYAYKSIDTDTWKDELYQYFKDKKSVLDSIDWQTWLYEPGMPPKPKYDSTLMNLCRELSSAWLSEQLPTDSSAFDKMSTLQKTTTLELIRASKKFPQAKMPSITSLYKLDATKNVEVRYSWLMLGLDSRWQPIIPSALAFVLSVGRLKHCKPIYKSLFTWQMTRDQAVTQFKTNLPSMHPITAQVIQKVLDSIPSPSN